MPVSTVIIVTAIIAAFVIFAVVLAWGDHQTRNLPKIANTPLKAPPAPAARSEAPASVRELA